MKKLIGVILFIIALAFVTTETEHFTNSFLPSSALEVLCDGMGLLLAVVGFYLIITKEMELNWFNHRSGKKLTKLQSWIVKNIEWKITIYSPFIVPLGIICTLIYIILHFLIKYW